MSKIKVRIINHSPNPLPEYATQGSAGMDLRAFLDVPVYLNPLERLLVRTGLFIELPKGYEGQVRPRSGLAIKYGITCLNSPGTIDADYRGEIKVVLHNLSSTPFIIARGMRIAQLTVERTLEVVWQEVEQLDETRRGEGAFGHTGY